MQAHASCSDERRRMARWRSWALALCVAYGLLAVPGVRLAQARWDLPGLILPALDALAWLGVGVFLVLVLRSRSRRAETVGEPEPPSEVGAAPARRFSGVDGCVIIAVWLLGIFVFQACDHLVRCGGVQANGHMATGIMQGDRWQANVFAYQWHGPQVGDVVAFRAGQGSGLARVVGVPTHGTAAVTRAPLSAPGRAMAGALPVDAGRVAIAYDNSAASSPGLDRQWRHAEGQGAVAVVDQSEITGRVVAVWWPLGRLRSL